jgi:phosphoenolpyruvate carboxykinase (GTP)
VTDSLYLTLCLLNLARVGAPAFEHLKTSRYFVRAIHSGLDLDPDRRLVAYFPQEKLIISIGSNFGADALLARKNITLTAASRLAAAEGWLVGNMAVFGVENPVGEKHYFAAALPTGFGKTSLAMLTPPVRFRGWRVTTVNTDAAWLRTGPDGRLYSVAPKAGYYGLLPGRNVSLEPNIAELLRHDCIFTNCGTTPTGDLWWEGMGKPPPASLYDWSGRLWDPNSGQTAAHPNSSFCAPETNNPRLDPGYVAPAGVPISAILFGGLRRSVYPPVIEALDWPHGVFLGATLSAERVGPVPGQHSVRYDPFGITAFIGYPLKSYLQGWLDLESKLTDKPRIFHINWFWDAACQHDSWANFARNFWILVWVFGRCSGTATAKEGRLGLSPELENIEELSRLPASALEAMVQPNTGGWRLETEAQAGYLRNLAIPPGIWNQWNALRKRCGLGSSPINPSP